MSADVRVSLMADGSDDHQGKPSSINRIARRDDSAQALQNLLDRLLGLVTSVGEQVFAGRKDAGIGDEGLLTKVSLLLAAS
jgi:hypothetical protein